MLGSLPDDPDGPLYLKGNNFESAVETSAAGDTSDKVNDNNKLNIVDINDIKNRTVHNKSTAAVDSDDSDDTTVSQDTVIEAKEANETETETIKDSNGKSSSVLDVERRQYELKRKADDPTRAYEVDNERAKNEEIQRRWNQDGHIYGMVWCGELRERSNSFSTLNELQVEPADPDKFLRTRDDGFTPVRPKKKRTANFSSSPEDEDPLKKTHMPKKRTKSMSENSGAAGVSNFFQVLADLHHNLTDDDEEANSTTRNPLQLSGESQIQEESGSSGMTVDLTKDSDERPDVVDLGSDSDVEEKSSSPAEDSNV